MVSTTVDGGGTNFACASIRGIVEVIGVRNSTGVLSEVLSTVIDLPWDRAGVCNWVVGVEKTRFGGVEYSTLSVVDKTGRLLSIEARGGGGMIEV
jgi:hypothetical protein